MACIFIAAGLLGVAYHLGELKPQHPFQFEIIGITLVRILAIIAGVYLLAGKDWARWLALSWMVFHVVVSVFHSLGELAVHALLLAVFTFVLLRGPAAAYFRGMQPRADL